MVADGLSPGWRRVAVALALVAVPLIGAIDYATGPEIGLSLLYLIPIAVSARYGGVKPAVLVACTAAGSWFAADLAWRKGDSAIAISLWNAFTRVVIYVSEGVFIAIIERDRQKLRRLVQLESSLARTDALTQLANSRSFAESAESAIADARARKTPLAALYVDLDNFKLFNDRLGHAAGDAILVEVGNVLTRNKHGRDIAARLGGDEFVMLLRDASEATAARVASQVTSEVRSMAAAYSDIGFGATVGVAFFETPPESVDELLRAADEAMYLGKAAGKSRVVVGKQN